MSDATHDPEVLSTEILTDGAALGREGFGTPIIVGAASMAERTRSYTSAKAASADATAGEISSSLAAYVADAYAQKLTPAVVKVGRREPDVAQVVTFEITGGADGTYSITINGVQLDETVVGASATDIATALASYITLEDDVTASSVGPLITVTSSTAGLPFTYASTSTGDDITETETQANVNISTELDAIRAEDADWYGLALESRDDTDNQRAMEWAQANGRLVALQNNDKTAALALALQAGSYTRGFLMYREDNASTAAWKLLTNRLSINLDRFTSTWSFVTLVGETADTLTDTEKATLLAANVALYLTLKKVPCTRAGVSPGGEKLDVRTTVDITKARIEEELARIVIDASNRGRKINFDDTGFAQLENAAKGVLKLLENAGHFQATTTSVKFTRFSDLTSGDIAARRCPYIFGGLLAGAVEAFEGVGYVTTDETLLASLFDD